MDLGVCWSWRFQVRCNPGVLGTLLGNLGDDLNEEVPTPKHCKKVQEKHANERSHNADLLPYAKDYLNEHWGFSSLLRNVLGLTWSETLMKEPEPSNEPTRSAQPALPIFTRIDTLEPMVVESLISKNYPSFCHY
uniref:Uncharacterized protein n=1 Tax=Arundo donax TaxID=35708 RepID=A0A0A9HMQ6_ARUDO